MKPIFILLVVLIGLDTYGQAVQVRVLQLEKDRFKAMIRKDSLFLSSVLSEELLYIHSNGVQDSKATLIKNIRSGNVEYHSIDLQQADIRTNNQTAWIHGVAKMKVRMGNAVNLTEMVVRYLDIYQRENGMWKLVAWQSSRLN